MEGDSMIQANTDRKWLPLYEALASEVRLLILEKLAEMPMNVKELAEAVGLSSAIITMHVRKLEAGGLIQTRMVRKEGGTHKICTLAESTIEVQLPQAEAERRSYHEISVPVGHYTQFEVYPTCGIATQDKVIGQYDDPRYFLEPERMYAHILWFTKGYVEYRVPNYLFPGQTPAEIEISMELGSEAPGINENWPSDISFYLNGVRIGIWTCPGDFGQKRGRYTPDWWQNDVNQYGLLKVIRIQEHATYLDGLKLSDITLKDIPLDRNQWTLRLAVEEEALHKGGLTIYGEGFGNYNQDIVLRIHYK